MGVCEPWITTDDLPCDLSEASDEQIAVAIEAATEWLYDATCQAYPGSCSAIIRPRREHHGYCQQSLYTAHSASSVSKPAVDLTAAVPGPITEVVEVTVAGTVVDPAEYALVNARWLVRREPSTLSPWPVQDYDWAADSERGWTVEVVYGAAPPSPLRLAAAELACQLLKRWLGKECDLPDNASSITRGGVTVSLQARAEGKIGIPLIDAIVDAYGCTQRERRLVDPAKPWTAVERIGS
ncbi:MAG: hypothetical protein ACOYOQ_00050 [Microthrixaceae bacterium]